MANIKDFKNALGILATMIEQGWTIDKNKDGNISIMEIMRAAGAVGLDYTLGPVDIKKLKSQWLVIKEDPALRAECIEHFREELEIKGHEKAELIIEKIVALTDHNYSEISEIIDILHGDES